MTMWMDKINDQIDYNSVGDSYYCNIGIMYDIVYWKWTVLFSESAIRQCLLHVNVKGVNTLKNI